MPELKAKFVRVLEYLEDKLEDESIFDWILSETAARGIPQMAITPEQGRTLNLLVRLMQARRILEFGTLGGYSSMWMAKALPPDGKITSLEFNEKHAQLARDAFAREGLSDRFQVIVGPALESMTRLELDAPLDLAFIDADKVNNLNYFNFAFEHLRPGGLIIVDNVVLNAHVLDPDSSATMRSVYDFNQLMFDRYTPRVTVIPFFKKEEDNLDAMLVLQKN